MIIPLYLDLTMFAMQYYFIYFYYYFINIKNKYVSRKSIREA